MKNLKEFKELIKKYESITLKDIKNSNESDDPEYVDGETILGKLTGFGQTETCTLCRSVVKDGNADCGDCVHGVYYKTIKKDNNYEYYPCITKSYHDIEEAENEEQVLSAIERRIEYMKQILFNLNL